MDLLLRQHPTAQAVCHSLSDAEFRADRAVATPQWDAPDWEHSQLITIHGRNHSPSMRVQLAVTVTIASSAAANVSFEGVLFLNSEVLDSGRKYWSAVFEAEADLLKERLATSETSVDNILRIVELHRTSPHGHEQCLTPTHEFCICLQ